MAAESTNELVDAIKSLTEEQQAEVADVLSPHLQPSIGRRQMLGIGGATGLAALLGGSAPVAASQAIGPAAAADGVLSDINVLESGDGTPMEFGNAVAFDHEAVSSSTTIGNVTTIEYDSSVAGFTITIPTTLEIHGMVLEFVDVGGSAGTNSVDVTTASGNNIDGQGTVTLDASSSYYRIVWRDGEWTSRIFTERVDAGTITTEEGVVTPSDADTEAGTNISEKISLAIRGPDTARTIVLQNQDDSLVNGEGKASIYWYTDSGERLASIGAHPAHNHFSLYTKQDAVGSGDTGLAKRLNVEGGSADDLVQWINVDTWELQGQANTLEIDMSNPQSDGLPIFNRHVVFTRENTNGEVTLRGGTANADVAIHFEDETASELWRIFTDGSQSDRWNLFDPTNTQRVIEAVAGGDLTLNPSGDTNIDGDININPSNTFSLSNVTTDRVLDANSTSDAELADVLATLIQDLGMDA